MAYLSVKPSSGSGIDGTLTAGRVPFASDSDTLTDDGEMTYDATNDLLTVTKVLTQVVVDVHNATGSAIAAGTPVYVTGSVTASKPNVEPSDADNAGTMPSAGIVTNQIGAGSSGYMAISGIINGLSLSIITDGSPSAGDTLYVSTTAGKLTVTKPTGTTSQIQNVGRIISTNGGNFKMTVNNIGRTNDIPNEFSVPGDIEAASFTVTSGAGTDFLKGDGTLDSNTYQQVLSEGAFVDGDKDKLDGIETGADVTDAANVAAAGALMKTAIVNTNTSPSGSAADSGEYFYITSGSFTLPASTSVGEQYVVLNNTGGSLSIGKDSGDSIIGSTSIDDDKAATIVCVAANTWFVVG